MSASHRFCLAPMLDWSDRHCRYFWRLLTRRARLYTEMVTTGALIHGARERYLQFDPAEHPLALQLGGSDPAELAACVRWAEQAGFDEVNLNCGCPSDRVQSGMFGACLMAQPERVAAAVRAMREACAIPVTVKHRIGIDDMESYDQLRDFVAAVAEAGCEVFIVHARKAWLRGLSPKENREIPPLNYPWVYRLKRELPALDIVINGGIQRLDDCKRHLTQVDGVMIGREAYHNPWGLIGIDRELFGDPQPAFHSPDAVLQALLPYIERELADGTHLNHITRHLMGLYQGVPGARRFRRHLSENAHRPGAGVEILQQAMDLVGDATERATAGAADKEKQACRAS